MVGGNDLYANDRTRPYYFRRCKRLRSTTNIESLPDDLLFNILLQLPADDISDSAMFVCRKWYNIIHSYNFIDAHYQLSTPGLLVHDHLGCFPIFVGMQNDRIEISKLNYAFECEILSSCNGLMLQSVYCKEKKVHVLYISCPTTKQYFSLPQFCLGVVLYSCLAHVAASKQYKVFIAYECNDYVRRCAILTVGVDESWRHLAIEYLPFSARDKLFDQAFYITNGFMHWTPMLDAHVVTLNVETEIFKEIPVPRGYENSIKWFVSSENCLSLLFACTEYLWEVWEMKSETGEWMKLRDIDFEAHKRTFRKYSRTYDGSRCYPHPVGWLKDGEVLVFHVCGPSNVCIAYNAHTQEIDTFELGHDCGVHIFNPHRNCLVRLPRS